MAARYPPCARTSGLGESCASADADGAISVAACVSDPAGAEPLVCAKQQDGGAIAVCVMAVDAEASASTIVRCEERSSTPVDTQSPPPAAESAPGVCCGANVLVSTISAVSECCAWEVDSQGQCCAAIDGCGRCSDSYAARDAEGAGPPMRPLLRAHALPVSDVVLFFESLLVLLDVAARAADINMLTADAAQVRAAQEH